MGIAAAAGDGAEAIGMAGSEAAVGVVVAGAVVAVGADLAAEGECPVAEAQAAHGNDEKAIGANH